ncbi:protein O-mannosyl-transferase TMTC3 [Pelomyxa schiedti]|nr:protein O-mannosyl-transferase TMTC3 [Pelomyxa schiedti]
MKGGGPGSKTQILGRGTESPTRGNTWIHGLLLSLVCVSVGVWFSNAVHGQFCFDDHAAIERNLDVVPSTPYYHLLHHDFWGNDIASNSSHKSFRPVTVLSFKLTRLFYDKFVADSNEDGTNLNTPPQASSTFRFWNVMFHALVCITVYLFSLYMFPGDSLTAFLSAVLFSAHPIHVEAVSGIVGRAEILCALFCLLSFFTYEKCTKPGIRGCGWFMISMVLCSAAFFSKETGLSVLPFLLCYDLLETFTHSNSGYAVFCFVCRCFTCSIWGLMLLILRKSVTLFMAPNNLRHLENPLITLSGSTLWLNIGLLHSKYLQLLVLPLKLSPDYSFNCLPLVDTWLDVKNIISVGIYSFAIITTLICLRKLEHGRVWLLLLAWFCTFFFPASNILFFPGTFIGERLLYLPSISFCVAASKLFSYCWNKSSSFSFSKLFRLLEVLSIVLLLSFYGITTLQYNDTWNNDATLFAKALEVCPNSAKVHFILGRHAFEKEEYSLAIKYNERALEIEPLYCEVYYSIGVSRLRSGQVVEGLELIKRGFDCPETKSMAAEALKTIYGGNLEQNPSHVPSILGIAEIRENTGEPELASVYYLNAAIILSEQGQPESVLLAEKAALLSPSNCAAHLVAANIMLHNEGSNVESIIQHLQQAAHEHNCSDTAHIATYLLAHIT